MSVAERSMAFGLRALNNLAGSELVERAGLRKPAERLVYRFSRDGVRAAGAAGRTFTAVTRLGRPARLKSTSPSGVFDLTPDDEQQMLRDTFKEFGAGELRPIAQQADADCAAPDELIAQAAELGLTMLGVPEELGGAVSERSAMTTILVAEALAQGDAGLATAILAPAGVAPTSSRPTCRRSSPTTFPTRPSRCSRAARSSTRTSSRPRPGAPMAATSSTAPRPWCRARPRPSCSWSPPSSRAPAPRSSSSSRRPTASSPARSRRWACAPPPRRR
jgi:hypothetical protein